MRPSHVWFWFSFSLVKKVARVLLTNHRAQESKTKAITKLIAFNTQLKAALYNVYTCGKTFICGHGWSRGQKNEQQNNLQLQ